MSFVNQRSQSIVSAFKLSPERNVGLHTCDTTPQNNPQKNPDKVDFSTCTTVGKTFGPHTDFHVLLKVFLHFQIRNVTCTGLKQRSIYCMFRELEETHVRETGRQRQSSAYWPLIVSMRSF